MSLLSSPPSLCEGEEGKDVCDRNLPVKEFCYLRTLLTDSQSNDGIVIDWSVVDSLSWGRQSNPVFAWRLHPKSREGKGNVKDFTDNRLSISDQGVNRHVLESPSYVSSRHYIIIIKVMKIRYR